MSVILEISIFPMDKGHRFSPYVARAVDIIRKSGLNYSFGPMGTCIEGSWDEVVDLAGRCMKELQRDSERVYMNMKADWHKGRTDGLTQKVRSVEEKLNS